MADTGEKKDAKKKEEPKREPRMVFYSEWVPREPNGAPIECEVRDIKGIKIFVRRREKS